MPRHGGKSGKSSIIALVLIGVVVVAVLAQAGLIQWHEPTPLYIAVPNGPTLHVADLWQEWAVRYDDGTTKVIRSDVKVPFNFQLAGASLSYTKVTIVIDYLGGFDIVTQSNGLIAHP